MTYAAKLARTEKLLETDVYALDFDALLTFESELNSSETLAGYRVNDMKYVVSMRLRDLRNC